LEEGFGNVPIEQALAALGEHIPDGVIQVQAFKPTTNGTTGYSRAVPSTAIRCAPRTALAARARNNFSDAIDGRPVLAYSLWSRGCSSLNAPSIMTRRRRKGRSCSTRCSGLYVAEHIQLLLIFSTHAFFLSGCAVETREFRDTPSASNRVFPQPAK